MEKALVSLAERVSPSVVSISPYVPPTPTTRRQSSRGPRPTNSGTGVIIDAKQGFVVTNSHVVKEMDNLEIKLYKSGRKYLGYVLGVDEETDLAVIKINADEPLVEAKLGDSSKVRRGQIVVALGNPFGLNDSISFGVVSGLNRDNINVSRYEDFLQTDASINPGNSGGPLFSIRGEVIGINTAIINYAQGIGFSIPSNMVKDIVSQLVQNGSVQRGWLGAGIESMTPEIAKELNVKENEGVYVNAVFDGDPAGQAGLAVGDVITRVGGAPVDSSSAMIRVIGAISPGQTVSLDIIRKGERKTISVKLGSMKKPVQLVGGFQKFPVNQRGFIIQEVESERPDKTPSRVKGVVVAEIFPKSDAEKGGLMKGDIVMAINGRKVVSQEDFKKIMGEISLKEPLFLLIFRNQESLQITIPGES